MCEANNKIHSQLLGSCRVIYLNNFTSARTHTRTRTRSIVPFSLFSELVFLCASRFFSVMLHLSKQYIFCAMSMHVGKISCVPLIYGAETFKDTHEYTYRARESEKSTRSAQHFRTLISRLYQYLHNIYFLYLYFFNMCLCFCVYVRERVAVLLPLQISCVSQSINTYKHISFSFASLSLHFEMTAFARATFS